MTRICFICHGNICRSPMAEFVMKALVRQAGAEDRYEIASRATHTDEIWRGVGNPIYPPTQRELRKNGIPFDQEKRAQLLTKSDAAHFDLFVGMDSENMRWIPRLLGSAADGKAFRLLSFTAQDGDVSDPWYSGDFRQAYDDIYHGCTALLAALEKRGGSL